jgi:hypothetical protein
VLNSKPKPRVRKILDQAEPIVIFDDESTLANLEDADDIPTKIIAGEAPDSTSTEWRETLSHPAYETDLPG